MATLNAPLNDIMYLNNEFLDSTEIAQLPHSKEVTNDLSNAIFSEAAKVSEEILFPLNRPADEQGCQLNNGAVITPDGFKRAYQDITKAGWGNLTCLPKYGGQGMPHYISNAVDEMLISGNMAFSIYMGLTIGAYYAIEKFASEEIKKQYLPNMVSGKWSGTMCLTEPHCGTDLGLIRSKATPQNDGTYEVTGHKIFISAGEHDLTENIIHLVLARTPNAPLGTKGISLFLVPKIQVNPDDSLGQANGVSCIGLEDKMGIKASATCSLEFEASRGLLVGELYQGIPAMFIMMNTARIHVGIQGLAVAQASYSSAVNYAKQRLQGRSLTGPKAPERYADPLIVHPDIRRMLMTMKAYTEGARAFSTWLSLKLDLSQQASDVVTREKSEQLISLMTPIFKSFLTDIGESVTSMGIQIYGGHGYIRENGMEQYLRDARICQIYEGANGIQALDLIGRKIPSEMGKKLRYFFHPLSNFIKKHKDDGQLSPYIAPLEKSFKRLQTATLAIGKKSLNNPEATASTASDYLELFGLVAVAYMWAKICVDISRNQGAMTDDFYDAKLKTGLFYMQRILPQTSSLMSGIMSESGNTMGLTDEQF